MNVIVEILMVDIMLLRTQTVFFNVQENTLVVDITPTPYILFHVIYFNKIEKKSFF